MTRRRGTIECRGRDKWRLRLYLGVSEDGKRKYLSRTVTGTKREARRVLALEVAKLDTAAHVPPTQLTLNDVVELWTGTERERVKPGTLKGYLETLERHVLPNLGSKRIERISSGQVESLVLGLKGSRIRQLVKFNLSKVFNYAVRHRMLAANPCDVVDLPAAARKSAHRALSATEVEAFLTAASTDQHYALWVTLLGTGLRPNEAYTLRWRHVDFDKGVISIRDALKTSRAYRDVDLDALTLRGLRDHKRAQAGAILEAGSYYDRGAELVFADSIGRQLHGSNLRSRHLKPILDRAGLGKLRIYDLRHTHATLLLSRGVPPATIAQHLGHSLPVLLKTYAHADPEQRDRVVQAVSKFLPR